MLFRARALNILGTKLGLQIDLWGRSVIKYKPRTEKPYSVGKSNLHLASQFLNLFGTTVANSLTMAFGGVKVSAHYGFIRDFVKSVKTDSDLPVNREEAKENVKIIEIICNQLKPKV